MIRCPHNWEPANEHVAICFLCGGVRVDPTPPVRIKEPQAIALGFSRNDKGLLEADHGLLVRFLL